jgi:hypothetical protein
MGLTARIIDRTASDVAVVALAWTAEGEIHGMAVTAATEEDGNDVDAEEEEGGNAGTASCAKKSEPSLPQLTTTWCWAEMRTCVTAPAQISFDANFSLRDVRTPIFHVHTGLERKSCQKNNIGDNTYQRARRTRGSALLMNRHPSCDHSR